MKLRSVLKKVFTTVVVLLLAALLLAVLWPITTDQRPARPVTRCMSQVRQMDLAVLMYAADSDERLPPASSWIGLTLKYLKDEALYHDPEVPGPNAYGYAFRDSGSLIKWSKVRDPAAFPVIFDSTVLGRNAHSELETLPNPGRHNGRNSIGYLDGHAKSVQNSEVK